MIKLSITSISKYILEEVEMDPFKRYLRKVRMSKGPKDRSDMIQDDPILVVNAEQSGTRNSLSIRSYQSGYKLNRLDQIIL